MIAGYRQVGIALPHQSRALSKVGHAVAWTKEPIKPGDLLSCRYRDWMPSRKVTANELRSGKVPIDLTGVEWPNGKIECRARVTNVDGSLAAAGETFGVVLTDPTVTCDHCSEACG